MTGQTLSHYQIQEKLGEGGMGVVYKAIDTHLNRPVALKLLPADKVSNPERRKRFVQEARAASALNHPNIVTIHDIASHEKQDFIAMEFIQGKTLDQLQHRKALSLTDTLKYSVQIADALARAHTAGIVHRDLKPSNIMVTDDGRLKVLDFGLAKLVEPDQPDAEASTRTLQDAAPKTDEGAIVGTAAYMSPEQAEGKRLDGRSDIFSFGSVLYEMSTGRRAFQGETKLSTLSAILREEPKPASELAPAVPRDLEKIIQRCLRKDPERRYQSMKDVKIALEELKEESDSGQLILQKSQRRKMSWLGLGALSVGLFALAAVGVAWYARLRSSSVAEPSSPIPLTSYPGIELSPTFSPDGSQIAFSWNGEHQDNFDIYVKVIDGADARRLTRDPARDMSPAWSPDGRQIAFAREGAVFLIEPTGSGEHKVADIRVGDIEWTRDSKSLVVSAGTFRKTQLLLLSIETGDAKELTSPPASQEFAFGDFTVAVSPDGLNLAFVRWHTSVTSDLYLMPLSGGQPRRLTQNELPNPYNSQGVTWTADGHEIVYSRFPSLWRRSIDARSDSPSKRVEGIDWGVAGPVISRPAFGSPVRLAYERLVVDSNIWVSGTEDSAAAARQLISSTQWDDNPQFSPDGRRIAFASNRSSHSGEGQIWIANSDGSNPLQLTSFLGGFTNSPRWSPDGRRIVFSSMQNNNRDLYLVSTDGGSLRRLTSEPSEEGRPSWSRDGRWIYCYSNRTGRLEIWKVPAEGGQAVQVTYDGGHESFESPDGKLLYYEDQGIKGLRSISTENSSRSKEGTVVLSVVRPGFWAVAEKGIYFVQFDDRHTTSNFLYDAFVVGTSEVSQSIMFHDFKTKKVRQIGALDKPVIRTSPSFSVTWDGRTIAWSQVDRGESDLMLVENFR